MKKKQDLPNNLPENLQNLMSGEGDFADEMPDLPPNLGGGLAGLFGR